MAKSQPVKPGPARVTLKEVARRSGVGISTAGFALSGEGRVSRSTAERILAAAQELGYSPASNRTARRMASIRLGKPFANQAIALFLPSYFPQFNYYHEIQRGILDLLANEGYDLLTARLNEVVESSPLPHAVQAGEVDGAITLEPELAARLRALPSFGARPIVGIINQFDQCSSVQADDEGGGCMAAGHLLDLGHRHILHFYCEGRYTFSALRRIEGYHRACRERGLDPRAIIHGFYTPSDLPPLEWAVRHLWEGLKRYPETTALLTSNDEIANVVYSALISAGRRVPEEISLVGFDDVHAVSDVHGRNILTTVNLSLRTLGEMAGRLLVELIAGKVSGDVRETVPAQLVVRASTAAPRSSRANAS